MAKISDNLKKLFIATDHAAVDLKANLIADLDTLPWEDLGPATSESVDYPDYAHKLCDLVDESKGYYGILICGSGQGMALAANKHKNIRAALCWNDEITKLSRQHNDANVLCLGARFIDEPHAISLIKLFLETEFEGGRHKNRVSKI